MARTIKNKLFLKIIVQLWERLSPRLRVKTGVLLLAQVIGSFLEVLSIAAIVPVIITLARPNMANSSGTINDIHRFFGSPPIEDFMLYLLMALVGFFALKTLFLIYISHLGARFAFGISLELAENQALFYMNTQYLDIKKENTYRLMHNSMQIPTQAAYGIVLPMLILLSEGLVALLILIAISIYQPAILLALLVTIGPVLAIIFFSIKKKMAAVGQKIDQLNPLAAEWIHTAYRGYVDIKLHRRQRFFRRTFTTHLNNIYNLMASRYTYGVIPQKVTEFAAIFAILIIFIFTRAAGSSSEQLVVFLSLFAAAAYRLLPSFSRLFGSLMTIKHHQHVVNILKPKFAKSTGKPSEVSFQKALQLQNLTYAFPDDKKEVLKGINATINKGDIVGIFGPSGSGKSTLMYMILGFLYPDSGQILTDGQPLQENDIPAWQKKLALVKQDIFLLDGNIRENIVFGDENPDLERMQEAIKLAGLEDFVSKLDEGPKTKIGEEGVRLSTGQRQRLGIARALYKNAELMVFDEATNAIDIQTEHEIIEELDKLRSLGKTIVLIAHRHTTLKKCNRILILHKGKITGETTYEDLSNDLRQKEMI